MDIRPNVSSNGLIELDQIKNKLKLYKNMGVSTLHLKDLMQKNISMELIQKIEDDSGQIQDLFENVHKANLTIIVQVRTGLKKKKEN